MRIFKIKPLILTALIIAILSLHPCTVMAQTVAVTGTITDTQTTPYSNGLLTVTFVNSTGQQATFGGNPSFQKSYAIYLDANGAFTISLPPNSTASPSIQPAGTQWNFSYQSQGGYGAANINVTITGAGSISGTLSNLARITWPYGNIPPPGAAGQGLVFVTSTTLGWGSTGGGGGVPFAAGGGVAQAQTVSPTPAIVALTNGLQVCWLPIAANTAAAPTLSISGLAAKPITKYGIVALVANDITTVAIACAVYDGTEFQLQVPLAGGVYSGSINIGSGASAAGATATGGFAAVEAASTGWTPTAGQDYCRADSTVHNYVCAPNGVAELPMMLGTLGSCGTANALALYTASTTLGCGLADFTYATHTLTGAAAGLVDFSAFSDANGFKAPFGAGTAGSGGGAIKINSSTGAFTYQSGGAVGELAIAGLGGTVNTNCGATNQVIIAIAATAIPTCHTVVGADMGNTLTLTGAHSSATYLTATNCSSSASPAVCGSAAAGSVAVPTGVTPTLVVNTTAVTANSQILFTPDESLGTKLSVTCNSTIAQVAIEPIVTARTAATSFTIQYNTTITVNPICLSYFIVN